MALPAKPAPALSFPLLEGGTWTLAERTPENFSIVVFYRGKHCPICKKYMQGIDALIDDAAGRGVEIVAVSMDGEEKTRETHAEIGTANLPIGYDLPEQMARDWGLYMTSGREGTAEPAVFSEPGLFVVQPDGLIFFAQKQSAPFTRPDIGDLLQRLTFVLEKNYPARGDLT